MVRLIVSEPSTRLTRWLDDQVNVRASAQYAGIVGFSVGVVAFSIPALVCSGRGSWHLVSGHHSFMYALGELIAGGICGILAMFCVFSLYIFSKTWVDVGKFSLDAQVAMSEADKIMRYIEPTLREPATVIATQMQNRLAHRNGLTLSMRALQSDLDALRKVGQASDKLRKAAERNRAQVGMDVMSLANDVAQRVEDYVKLLEGK